MKISFCFYISAADVYYRCVNAINCTGKNMSVNLLRALDEADAEKYACSKDLRPSENRFYLFFTSFRCD